MKEKRNNPKGAAGLIKVDRSTKLDRWANGSARLKDKR